MKHYNFIIGGSNADLLDSTRISSSRREREVIRINGAAWVSYFYLKKHLQKFYPENGQKPESNPEIKLSSKVSYSAASISVHVWDSNTGQPVAGLKISLHKQKDDIWNLVCRILTDNCGECCELLYGEPLTNGLYKLNLDTKSYYSKLNQRCLYPYIEIVFDVQNTNELYHFPIQLSPLAYNVCRLLKC